MSFLFSYFFFLELECYTGPASIDRDACIIDLIVPDKELCYARKCLFGDFSSLSNRSLDTHIDEIIIITWEDIESHHRCEYDEAKYQESYREKYRESAEVGMFEKIFQYSLVPLSDTMNYSYS